MTIFYEIDRFINEIIIGKEYESLIPFPLKDAVILDLGCNIGTFSLSVYDRASKIYAVDLIPNRIELFNKTIEANNLTKITTFCQAIASSNRIVKVDNLDSTDGGPSIYGNNKEIRAITLSELFKQQNIDHIDLMKVDIECAEQEIFGSEDFHEIKDKIHVIMGEAHNDTCPDISGFECTRPESRKFLAINKNYGYDKATNKEF